MSELEPARVPSTPAQELPAELTELVVPNRRRLPDTRPSITHKFSINGYEGYISVGLFDDGQPGEVFLKMAKEGHGQRTDGYHRRPDEPGPPVWRPFGDAGYQVRAFPV